MTIRSRSELNFRYTAGALATVEINLDSLERAGFGLEDILAPALARLAAEDPAASATVYSQSLASVNFGQPCWSLFLAVCGSPAALRALAAAFRPLPGVESRFSDEIAVKRAQARYHLQDGALWLPADEFSWQRFALNDSEGEDGDAVEPAASADAGDPDDSAYADSDDEESHHQVSGDEDEDEDEDESEPDDNGASTDTARRNGRKVRRQIARADASVGTIRQTIEELFGLPAGSVALRGPDGRPLRADATIRTLRNRWWGA